MRETLLALSCLLQVGLTLFHQLKPPDVCILSANAHDVSYSSKTVRPFPMRVAMFSHKILRKALKERGCAGSIAL